MSSEQAGGKPRTDTPADRRLKANQGRPPHGAPQGRPGPAGEWDQSRKRPRDRQRQSELDQAAAEGRGDH